MSKGKALKPCKGCEQGLEPLMLDEDGVLCTLSNKPGDWCHAVDDAWGPCDRMRSVFDSRPLRPEGGVKEVRKRLEQIIEENNYGQQDDYALGRFQTANDILSLLPPKETP